MYKPSEKVQILSAPAKDLGPEFRAGEVTHEIDRYRAILRNADATPEDKVIAAQRLMEFDAIASEAGGAAAVAKGAA